MSVWQCATSNVTKCVMCASVYVVCVCGVCVFVCVCARANTLSNLPVCVFCVCSSLIDLPKNFHCVCRRLLLHRTTSVCSVCKSHITHILRSLITVKRLPPLKILCVLFSNLPHPHTQRTRLTPHQRMTSRLVTHRLRLSRTAQLANDRRKLTPQQ